MFQDQILCLLWFAGREDTVVINLVSQNPCGRGTVVPCVEVEKLKYRD